MSASKLFTPKLRAAQPTAIRKSETDRMFVNPPTHAEIPVFNAPTAAGFPLRMTKAAGVSTETHKRRPVSSNSDHGKY